MDEKNNNFTATAHRIRYLARQWAFSPTAFLRAMHLAGNQPDANSWRQFLERLFLISGATLMMVGVMAFFAFNWAELPYLVKLAFPQVGMLIAVVAVTLRGLDNSVSKVLLVIAAICVGLALAMYGQTYQTGADPYGLFVGWAVLILAWTLIARSAGLWLLMIVLINLAFVLYWAQILHPPRWDNFREESPIAHLIEQILSLGLAQRLFEINIVMVVIWEAIALRVQQWMDSRYLPRLIGLLALTMIMMNTLAYITHSVFYEERQVSISAPILYVVSTSAGIWFYQFKRRDILMLTFLSFGLVVVFSSLLIKGVISSGDMLRWDIGGWLFILLFIGGAIIGQLYMMTNWLRKIRRRWREQT